LTTVQKIQFLQSKELLEQNLQSLLRSSAHIGITFNDIQYTPNVDYRLQVFVRLLCAYLFEDRVAALYGLKDCFDKENTEALPTELIGDIISHHGGLLLCIDELVKLGGDVLRVLSLIGDYMDRYPKLHVVTSTLNSVVVNQLTIDSGRKIEWLPLPRPSVEQILHLCVPKNPNWGNSSALRRLVLQCGGHWRTLSELFTILNTGKFLAPHQLENNSPKSFEKVSHKEEVQFMSEVMCRLREEVKVLAIQAPLNLVVAALLGEKVELNEVFDDKTLAGWIAFGCLTNTTTNKDLNVLPTFSPIALHAWMKEWELK